MGQPPLRPSQGGFSPIPLPLLVKYEWAMCRQSLRLAVGRVGASPPGLRPGGQRGAPFGGARYGAGRRDYLGYYAMLGLDAAATESVSEGDVKKAFRQAALRWHPRPAEGVTFACTFHATSARPPCCGQP